VDYRKLNQMMFGEAEAYEGELDEVADGGDWSPTAKPAPKPRGRPKKAKAKEKAPPAPRGRPRKKDVSLVVAKAAPAGNAAPPSASSSGQGHGKNGVAGATAAAPAPPLGVAVQPAKKRLDKAASAALRGVYEETPLPSQDFRRSLAEDLGLSKRHVDQWFASMRSRQKKREQHKRELVEQAIEDWEREGQEPAPGQ